MKSAEEIMEILEAYDLTGSFRDAAELAGCSHHTVAGYVARRDAGQVGRAQSVRPMLIDGFLPQVEAWVQNSQGKVRADVVHDKLLALGFTGSERTTRRAVASVKAAYRLGRVRVHRPWVSEPGLWLQYDFGDGPVIDGVKTVLFCAWLAWSRFAGGAAAAGQDTAECVRRPGRDAAPTGGRADVCADRQREDCHGRARRRDPGAQQGDARLRRALLE